MTSEGQPQGVPRRPGRQAVPGGRLLPRGDDPPDLPAPPAGGMRGPPRAPRCLVMGVVNVTPGSFSDGGNCAAPDAAIAGGISLAAAGADIVDVGGESTRPGARRVAAEEELRRVMPVITGLAGAGVCVSVDTMRAEVAERALGAGARMVND